MNDSAGSLLDSIRGPDDAALARVRSGLALRAQSAGLLDVAYCVVDAPIGPLLLAGTAAGLVRVAFAGEGHDRVLEILAQRISTRILLAPGRFDAAVLQLEEYFGGRRRGFDLPIDLRLAGGFRRVVLEHLRGVEYGATATYAGLAAVSGNPRAARAAGTACATNPIPIVVPCHRVVRSDGTIGRYGGGTEVKRALLDLEAAYSSSGSGSESSPSRTWPSLSRLVSM